MEVNIHEAKTHLSPLLDKVVSGEDIIIAKPGKPIAKLTALGEPKHNRVPARNKNKGSVHNDFNDPLPDTILRGFLGLSSRYLHISQWTLETKNLSDKVLTIIGDQGNQVFLSSASCWEIVIKYSLGRLDIPSCIW